VKTSLPVQTQLFSAHIHRICSGRFIYSTTLLHAEACLTASKDAVPLIKKNIDGSTVKKELVNDTTFDPP
jgi:hypothetical protein